MKNPKMMFVISLLCLSGLTTSCRKETQAHVTKKSVRPVRCQVVSRSSDGIQRRSFSGIAKSGLESTLSFKVAGTLNRLKVKVGDHVKKGQLIATLDSKDYQLQVQQVEAQLEQARAREANAKADYERVRGLYENQNAARSDLDAARTGYQSANASVSSIEKQLELMRSQRSYTELHAPFSGAVSAVNVEINENLQGGQPVIVLTAHVTRPEVEVAVPDRFIADVKDGQQLVVTFGAAPGKRFSAVVSEVGVAGSQVSTTYPVTATLKEADERMRPGMVAEVEFSFDAPENSGRIHLPSHAVQEDQHGKYVYIANMKDDGLATTERVKVSVGGLSAKGVEILDGLSEGHVVITAGVSRIREGMDVTLLKDEMKE